MNNYSKPRDNASKNLLKTPEPSVFKSDHPVKALHLMDDAILIGNDGG